MNPSRDVAAIGPMTTTAQPKRRIPTRGTLFMGFVLLLIVAFGRSLYSLFTTAFQSDLNSYIVLIPFVVLYFVHLERGQYSSSRRTSLGWAVLPAIAGFCALGARLGPGLSENDRLSVLTFAFICFVWTGGFLFLGSKWMTSASFPMLFLIFLTPLPDRLVGWMETGLQLASAEAANLFFAVSGTAAMKTGTVFQLPGISLQVAQECSGMKSSWVLFITSIIAAKLFLWKPWTRAVLVAAVIPLGILRNGFRIMVIGLLCVHIDPDMIHSWIHRRGGPVFFALSLIPLMILLWWLRKQQPRTASAEPAGEHHGRDPVSHSATV
jgi:exosortase C (VPDSG-CTERM-specific)